MDGAMIGGERRSAGSRGPRHLYREKGEAREKKEESRGRKGSRSERESAKRSIEGQS